MTTQNISSSWIKYIREITTSMVSGEFIVIDSQESPVVIEWEKLDPKTARLNEKIRSFSHFLIKTYSDIELDFAQKNPQAIENDMFLKRLKPLLENGLNNIDWDLAKVQISTILTDLFTKMDWSMYAKQNDIHFFMLAKDKESENLLGMIQFVFSHEFDNGSVKVELYDCVIPKALNLDIEKILLGSIFKLIPNIQRIFFHTRKTNFHGIEAHQELGFMKFDGDLPDWVDLEYKAEKSYILQKFIEVS